MKKTLPLILLLFVFVWILLSCERQEKRTFDELDEALAQREKIWNDYNRRLDGLKARLVSSSASQRLAIYDTIFWMYVDAFPDSSYRYAEKRVRMLEKGNDPAALLSARMDMLRRCSQVNIASSVEEFLLIDTSAVSKYGLTLKYLDYGTMLCYRMAELFDGDAGARYKALYESFFERYIQIDTVSARYAFFQARKLRNECRYKEVVDLLLPYCTDPDITDENLSVLATYLGRAYAELKDNDNAELWYAKSAVCDIYCTKHLHMSLAKLAMLLADRGENLLALKYGTIANEEALSYNAEHRIVEISPFLSKVSDEVIYSERQLRIYATFAAVIAFFFLLVAAVALTLLARAYKRTSELNRQISKVSQKLEEANILKENYMMHYMVKCTKYIRRVDDTVSGVKQMLKNDGVDKLVAELRKPKYSDSEFKSFYQEFDSIFLRLFPSFMDEVNSKVVQGQTWELSREKSLPMELRILAVMKIGISDNKDIAEFLNFPQASVYTYRYRLKKSFGLEDESFDCFISSLKI